LNRFRCDLAFAQFCVKPAFSLLWRCDLGQVRQMMESSQMVKLLRNELKFQHGPVLDRDPVPVLPQPLEAFNGFVYLFHPSVSILPDSKKSPRPNGRGDLVCIVRVFIFGSCAA
jgi:hypothetical protein